MRVEPDQREPATSRGKTLDSTDVRAAAAAQHDRSAGKDRCELEVLLGERVGIDYGGLRVRERQGCGVGHGLPALAPRARHADKPARQLSPQA